MKTNNSDVLIVGAGIAGLMAAKRLQEAGKSVLIVDKGRGVGGRMATRRIGPGRADHGAQFFTARSNRFKSFVQQWQEDGTIFTWAHGWSNDPKEDAKGDGYPRYAGSSGMTAVPKALAQHHEIRLGCQLVSVTAVHNQWHATDEEGVSYTASALLLTPPVPQSLTLLDAGNVALHHDDRTALERITYNPCIAGMFWVDGEVTLPAPGAIQRPEHTFSWLADNQRKGISPDAKLITVHVNPELSWEIWDAPQAEKVERILAGLRPFLSTQTQIIEAQAHRWRYAQPTTLHPARTLSAQGVPPLAFAGDAFKEARVEGAALSGLAAADAIRAML